MPLNMRLNIENRLRFSNVHSDRVEIVIETDRARTEITFHLLHFIQCKGLCKKVVLFFKK